MYGHTTEEWSAIEDKIISAVKDQAYSGPLFTWPKSSTPSYVAVQQIADITGLDPYDVHYGIKWLFGNAHFQASDDDKNPFLPVNREAKSVATVLARMLASGEKPHQPTAPHLKFNSWLNDVINTQGYTESNEPQGRCLCSSCKEKLAVVSYILARKHEDKNLGFVYAMKNLRNGYIKIGYSVTPEYREKTLQSEEPEIRLIAVRRAPKEFERTLHRFYDDRRLRGEWFDISVEEEAGLVKNLENLL